MEANLSNRDQMSDLIIMKDTEIGTMRAAIEINNKEIEETIKISKEKEIQKRVPKYFYMQYKKQSLSRPSATPSGNRQEYKILV
jgi:hypothetical protein